MKTRLFYTTGKQDIIETEWDKPEPGPADIEVKNVLTGVCRSDIDMYTGDFVTLPKEIQGHEGLGIVSKVGERLRGTGTIKEGDFVATRGEPSFADYYNAQHGTFVKVPALDPKYIIEPVACGINVLESIVEANDDLPGRLLILGSGFLATVVAASYKSMYDEGQMVVVGKANRDFWKRQSQTIVYDTLNDFLADSEKNMHMFKYDCVVDLTSNPSTLDLPIFATNVIIALAAEKHPAVTTTFASHLWNGSRFVFPSPRNHSFIESMELAVKLIQTGEIETGSLWTKAYARSSDVKTAFEEGLNRQAGYSRGYIDWRL